MTNTQLKTDGKSVLLPDGTRIQCEHAVSLAYLTDDMVIVLLDEAIYWREFGSHQFGQFPNLVAYDIQGHKLWTAQLPTNESSDCYVELVSVSPLVAYSWKSFKCTIDPKNGRIVSQVFWK